MKNRKSISSLFSKIKSDFNEEEKQRQTKTDDFIKFKPGNTYLLRLVPNKNNGKTFFHYYFNGWISRANGKYVYLTSPETWGNRNPINDLFFKLRNSSDSEDKENSKLLRRNEKWLVNVYVIDDPTNPENNGKIKIMNFGRQLHNIIYQAMNEDEDEFGERIFDLSSKGCNLKVKVEAQGDFPSYVSSRFTSPVGIPGLTSQTEIDKVYDSVHILEEIYTPKSTEEINAIIDEHFHCKGTPFSKEDLENNSPMESEDDVSKSLDDLNENVGNKKDKSDHDRIEEIINEINV